jgi:glycosidase
VSVSQKAIIYQLVVRYFGNTNETNQWCGTLATNGCGKFADISETALRELKQFGATHLWFTGCLRQATLTDYPDLGLPADDPDIVKGIAGSFYAVRDYFDVCPDYAQNPSLRMDEFKQLIGRAHQLGFKVIIDFVPNHVARSYGSVIRPDDDFGRDDDQSIFFKRENSFFYLPDARGEGLRLSRPHRWTPPGFQFDGRFAPEDGGPGKTPKATASAWKYQTTASPSETEWYEAVKLNYGFNYVDEVGEYDPIPKTWLIMADILRWWQDAGVDGFRCDMAHLIPHEAWSYLIGQARSFKQDVFFLAEAYVGTSPFDPVKSVSELLNAGFDAVYHDNSFNCLVDLYRGASLGGYDNEMKSLGERERSAAVEYLENHDKPRVAASIEKGGFGSVAANYQLAPLQLLYSNGPSLILNGQEVGEPAAGAAGFSGDDGRSTFFDYWCMPEFAKWVNGLAFDGARLSDGQTKLRAYFTDLLSLSQHPTVRGSGYWSLRYFNNAGRFADCSDALYSFARFESGGGQLLLVLANFAVSSSLRTIVRIPHELSQLVQLPEKLSIELVLDMDGKHSGSIVSSSPNGLEREGFSVTLRDQETCVFLIH